MIQVPDVYEDSRVLRYEVAVDGVICFTLAIIDIYRARTEVYQRYCDAA